MEKKKKVSRQADHVGVIKILKKISDDLF